MENLDTDFRGKSFSLLHVSLSVKELNISEFSILQLCAWLPSL